MKHFNLLNNFRWFATIILLITLSVGQMWGATFNKITSLSDLTTGNYVIVGQQGASSWGRLVYGTPDKSGRLAYTAHYTTSLPSSITTTTAGEIWYLTVSGTGATRTVTIYNSGQKMYLNSTSGKLAVSGSSADWTSKYSSGFRFAYGSYYLGVNKNSAYWRDYVGGSSSVLYNTSGYVLTLYKEAASCSANPTIGAASLNGSFLGITFLGSFWTIFD